MMKTLEPSNASRKRFAITATAILLVAVVSLMMPTRSSADVVTELDPGIPSPSRSIRTLTVTEQELLPRFPDVEGSNLEKRHYRLPEDFEGETNLVFIAFRRPQQAEVETWLPFARELAEKYPGFRFYELPTISIRAGMARFFINEGMRRGIPKLEAREATITLYIDKEPFREALDIPDEESIHILLVGREGRIHWRAVGPLTESSATGLERAVSRRLNAGLELGKYELADAAPLLESPGSEE
jgi:hypothetical protein